MKRMSEDMCPTVYTNFPIDTTVDAHALDSAVITGYLEATSRIEVPTVEAIPKDQYEARLKADMVAMLEDLDLRLEEMENPFSTRVSGCSKDGWEHGVKNSRFLVKEKINALKGDTE